MRPLPIWCILATLLVVGAWGQTATTNASFPANPIFQQLSSNVFQLGTVQLDKARRTVRFPAQLNLTNGALEYLLVTEKGKTHESLLKTKTEPYQIHLALLLLGAKGAPPSIELQKLPYEPYHIGGLGEGTNVFPRLVLSGDKLAAELSWITPQGQKKVRAEDLVLNTQSKTTASPGPWIFNGSRVVDGTFMAQREGSIVALVDDVEALINNPRPGHDNDEIWIVNTNALPATSVMIDVTLTLE